MDIEALDIPVNAVATALKDFFSKHLPSLFEKDVMKELEEIAGKKWNHFDYDISVKYDEQFVYSFCVIFQLQFYHEMERHRI